MIVRPLKLSFVPAAFTIFFGAEIGVMLTWIGILKIQDMLKKEKVPKDSERETSGKEKSGEDQYRSITTRTNN